LNIFLQDLRFALRQMLRSPGFAVTAILILALGIAANVIVFGVLQTMILQPLNLPRADRLVTFSRHQSGYPAFSYPEIRDVRDGSTSFSAVAATSIDYFGMEANGAAEPVWGEQVSGQYFAAVAIKPFMGRLLTPADVDHPAASQALVISWPAWKSRFNADPNIVGKTVRLDYHPYTIVGVTPEGFFGTEKFLQSDLFVPMNITTGGYNWMEDRSNQAAVFPIARLKDSITLAQAQAELNTLAARIQKQDPKDEAGLQLWLAPPGMIGNFVRHAARGFLGGVMGLAGIVLLAACANLGSLFAARTADRTREIAIRVAIGSSRWRIVRQVLLEAVVVSILGGALACALSWIALTGLAQWHPPTDYPVRFQAEPQPSLIAIAFLISLVAGMVFGSMPLRQIFNADPNDVIKSGNSTASAGRRWALRDVLLAAQIALAARIEQGVDDRHRHPAKKRNADEVRFERVCLRGRGGGTVAAAFAGKTLASAGSRSRGLWK
jgi:predicted permease